MKISAKHSGGGISLFGLLGLLLIGLKLAGVGEIAHWNWIWVLAPFWIGMAAAFIVIAAILFFILVAALIATALE